MKEATFSATDFKATCLAVLDRLATRDLERVTVTKRGRPVAVLTPPVADEASVREWLKSMRGSVVIPDGADLTEPAFDGVADAELGYTFR